MAYRITLRRGHPRKQFRRDGRLYVEGEPVVLDELSPLLRKELDQPGSWLKCEEIAPPAPPATRQEPNATSAAAARDAAESDGLDELTLEELRARAAQCGIQRVGRAGRARLVGLLRRQATEAGHE